jgi:asparagine synthase (glutamine-hydrolysing)
MRLGAGGVPTLTPLEVASCVVTGPTGGQPRLPGPRLPGAAPSADPVAALERVIVRALRRPPCLVSFSGGHDSSLILAAAMRAARREQLPLPVPVTWRVTAAPRADESAWQEAVVDALGVTDWIRLPADDDLDFVGPVATEVLRRHGLLHPANAYFHAPLIRAAAGGTLLTGAGGDQVLGRLPRPRRPWCWPQRPGPALAFGWLHPAAADRVRRGLRREHRARPARYENRPAWAWGRRDLELTRLSLALLGRDSGTGVIHPLLEPEFLQAICGSGLSPESAGGRAGLLGQVFRGCYPDAALRPRPKATFGEVFWRSHTRSLLAGWDGTGVDASVVDPAQLRAEWDRPQPHLCTALLVQQAWLGTAPAPVARRPLRTGDPRARAVRSGEAGQHVRPGPAS